MGTTIRGVEEKKSEVEHKLASNERARGPTAGAFVPRSLCVVLQPRQTREVPFTPK